MIKTNDEPWRERSGFTLVELLVVIGIIAIMIGILLPTLSRVREASRATVCMSNLREIGHAMLMYANDNHDKFPDKQTTGQWTFRRQPGLTNPLDPSSYPEWMGLAAVLHGIRYSDYNLSFPKAQVQTSLAQVLSRKGRYLNGKSGVWICPAFPQRFIDHGNTYAFSVAPALSTYTVFKWRRAKIDLLVWDNGQFQPYIPGLFAPPSTSGFTLTPQLYPHRSKRGRLEARTTLYVDLHVELVVTTPGT